MHHATVAEHVRLHDGHVPTAGYSQLIWTWHSGSATGKKQCRQSNSVSPSRSADGESRQLGVETREGDRAVAVDCLTRRSAREGNPNWPLRVNVTVLLVTQALVVFSFNWTLHEYIFGFKSYAMLTRTVISLVFRMFFSRGEPHTQRKQAKKKSTHRKSLVQQVDKIFVVCLLGTWKMMYFL